MNTPRNNPWRASPLALAVAALAPWCVLLAPLPAFAQEAAAPDAPGPYVVAANDPPPAIPAGMTGKEFFKNGDKTWEVGFSPGAYHWSNDSEHKRVGLVNLERHNAADHSFWGGALFTNSFGQNSAYAYYGHEWNDVFGWPNVYLKASVGIIYGYTGKYEDKVPVNWNGFAPVIIPGIGYRITPHDAVQVAVLGNAGLLFMYSRSF